MTTQSSFWSNKTVFVTGATGFLGGWLVRRLLELGTNVVALTHTNTGTSQFFAEGFDERTVVYSGKVQDQTLIQKIFESHPIDVLFHTAYGADVNRVLAEPLECFQASAVSTWQILDFLRKERPDCLSVISSTDKVYGAQAVPFHEKMPLKPLHPYETAKASQDLAAQTYGKVYGCPVAVTRCGNYFGGYDFNFTRLIPGTVRSIGQGDRPTLRSNGQFTRDFLYIEDAVEVQLLLAQQLASDPTLYGEAFNFSYGERMAVREIVRRICQLMAVPFDPIVHANSTAEIPDIELSSDKAKGRLRWAPAHGFTEGLRRTVAWYRAYFESQAQESVPSALA